MISADVTSERSTGTADTRPSLPLVAIAGAHGKSTVAFILASILQRAGKDVGSWITSGVYANGERLSGELAAWQRVVRAARVGELDVLLQELDPSVTLAVGLPSQAYCMAIATNVCGPDQVCARTEQAKRQQQALEELVDSSLVPGSPIVANADDRIVLQMISESSAEPILFALHAGNPALRHQLAQGLPAIWVDDEWIFLFTGERIEPVVEVGKIEAALAGALIPQLQNILAAAGGAWALGADLESIRSECVRFQSSRQQLPGRFNILRLQNGANIVIDSPRQLWSLRATLRGLRHRAPRQVLVSVGSLNALDETELVDAGRLLGSMASVVLLHSADESPARQEQIVAGLSDSGQAPLVLRRSDESAAIETICKRIEPDDLGVVLVEKVAAGLDQ